MKIKSCILFSTISVSTIASADLFHYRNIIIGDRAVGLAGAYSGISDDSSGIIYNPAGLAFLANTDISGSANAYYIKSTTYKNIIGDSDFKESSQGFFPSFFGGTQKFDNISPGLVMGVAFYSPDSELKEQNDKIQKPEYGTEGFHRSVNMRASTFNVAFAAGKRLFSNFSLGTSLEFTNTDELSQDFQYSQIRVTSPKLIIAEASKSKGNVYFVQSQNLRQQILLRGIEPGLAAQFVLNKQFVLGCSIKRKFPFKKTFTIEGDAISAYRFADGSVVQNSDIDPATPDNIKQIAGNNNGKVNEKSVFGTSTNPEYTYTSSNPIKTFPTQIRAGITWYATPSFLWALDVEHFTAANDGEISALQREAVTNFSTGMEYYIIASLPVRAGFFTNYDARPKIDTAKVNPQIERVDYYGSTFNVSWVESSNEIGAGIVYQQGKGEAQKIASNAVKQDVKASALTITLSASHQK